MQKINKIDRHWFFSLGMTFLGCGRNFRSIIIVGRKFVGQLFEGQTVYGSKFQDSKV